MIGVVVHLEDRWNYTFFDRTIDIMQMYTESVKALGGDLLIVVDKTTEGMFHKLGDIEISYKTLKEVLKAYPDATKLYFEHLNAIPSETDFISLEELTHPKGDVLYVFGGDQKGINLAEITLGEKDRVVSIQTSKYILWTIVAITVALYDRHMKEK